MKDIVVALLILLNSGFVAALCGVGAWVIWKRDGKLNAGISLILVTIGAPAAIVFVATLMGFK